VAYQESLPESKVITSVFEAQKSSDVRLNNGNGMSGTIDGIQVNNTPVTPLGYFEETILSLSGFSKELTESYDQVLQAWDSTKDKVRVDNTRIAIQDGGGILTGIVAVTELPREIGFGVIDAGLWLGGLFASEKIRAETVNGAVGIYDAAAQFDVENGAVRVSAGYENKTTGFDGKVLIGSDRVGVQFKNPQLRGPNIVSATRYSLDYTDGYEVELLAEYDAPKFSVPLPWKVAGLQLKMETAFGTRSNTTSGELLPSLNFTFKPKLAALKYFKVAIELRGPDVIDTRKVIGGKK
jgi:hypothetical protein